MRTIGPARVGRRRRDQLRPAGTNTARPNDGSSCLMRELAFLPRRPAALARPRLLVATGPVGRLRVAPPTSLLPVAARRLDGEGADLGNVDGELELVGRIRLQMELSQRVRDRPVQGLAAPAARAPRCRAALPPDPGRPGSARRSTCAHARSRLDLELDRVAAGLVEELTRRALRRRRASPPASAGGSCRRRGPPGRRSARASLFAAGEAEKRSFIRLRMELRRTRLRRLVGHAEDRRPEAERLLAFGAARLEVTERPERGGSRSPTSRAKSSQSSSRKCSCPELYVRLRHH